jgi:hypothetical protein
MKKLISVAFLLLTLCLPGLLLAANGPLDKGSLVLSGTSYFAFQSGDLYENSSGDGLLTISANIGLGYFTSPGFELGGNFDITTLKQGDASATTLSLGPEIGYYFGANRVTEKIKGNWYPYVKGAFQYSSVSSGGASANGTTIAGKVGIIHMLSNAVAEDLGLKFQKEDWEGFSGTTIWFGVGITAFIW